MLDEKIERLKAAYRKDVYKRQSPEAGMKIDELRTPCYVIDEGKLTENLLILNGVMQRTGAVSYTHLDVYKRQVYPQYRQQKVPSQKFTQCFSL